MPKLSVFILALLVIILTGFLTVVSDNSASKSISKAEAETAINQAKFLYNQKKDRGEDFLSGPCLSNALMPGWVVDIAHNPRQSIDDLAENQCAAYLEGGAQHFVELDLGGNVVRVK